MRCCGRPQRWPGRWSQRNLQGCKQTSQGVRRPHGGLKPGCVDKHRAHTQGTTPPGEGGFLGQEKARFEQTVPLNTDYDWFTFGAILWQDFKKILNISKKNLTGNKGKRQTVTFIHYEIHVGRAGTMPWDFKSGCSFYQNLQNRCKGKLGYFRLSRTWNIGYYVAYTRKVLETDKKRENSI